MKTVKIYFNNGKDREIEVSEEKMENVKIALEQKTCGMLHWSCIKDCPFSWQKGLCPSFQDIIKYEIY